MFICTFCRQPTKKGERMFKVPAKATAATAVAGPQILKEEKLCPRCKKRYTDALTEAAPDVNPQSAYAALVD